ncbi:hypothetical protein LSH36_11g10038 [Paralvinella palmiformis]|uniref:Uncharacterized protein n=1 Tax=Paralvinella palmiformis TaxID=53620 RepID=A0AAD9NGM4_9ANNE|nr:hypothetical protein LSH36_11g10038 [Paralvinella palmiformis]
MISLFLTRYELLMIFLQRYYNFAGSTVGVTYRKPAAQTTFNRTCMYITGG